MKKLKILKTNISELTLHDVTNTLLTESKKTVAVCNANTLVRSYKDTELQNIINKFDICTPDGFPVAMASRILYKNNQQRVDGFKIFNNTLVKSQDTDITHYFFGNTEEVVSKIINKYKENFPGVNIVGYCCPPFLNIDELTSEKYFKEIFELNPDIIWFSLGFPKQEKLISLLRTKYSISSNLVGVGFTFDWTAGTKYKAPEFIANIGLEWLFRLIQEPKRLYKRYLIDNSLFVLYFLRQVLFRR
tara:strand:+ start:1293 stop:2030 length:738 start_codon:yes stop_codon:yes gene_type:complete